MRIQAALLIALATSPAWAGKSKPKTPPPAAPSDAKAAEAKPAERATDPTATTGSRRDVTIHAPEVATHNEPASSATERPVATIARGDENPVSGATEELVSIARPHVASQSGQVRKCVSVATAMAAA